MYRIDDQLHQYRTSTEDTPADPDAATLQRYPTGTVLWRCDGRCGGEFPSTEAAQAVQLGAEVVGLICETDAEETEEDLKDFFNREDRGVPEDGDSALYVQIGGRRVASVLADDASETRMDLLQFFDLAGNGIDADDDDDEADDEDPDDADSDWGTEDSENEDPADEDLRDSKTDDHPDGLEPSIPGPSSTEHSILESSLPADFELEEDTLTGVGHPSTETP